MYATTRRYEGVTNAEEAARRVSEGWVPIVSSIPGFIAYYWVDAGQGVMLSTSVFHDEAGAMDSNRRAREWVAANIASLLPNPPLITDGPVVGYGVKAGPQPQGSGNLLTDPRF